MSWEATVLDDLLQPANSRLSISLVDLFFSLSLAFLVSLAAVFVYRITHRGLHYERSFLVTLALMPPVVCVVMMLISSNLALSLGMVGALSIIRFRTVIKDSRDMVYLFWSIAIGLGCGTQNWLVAVAASAFMGGAVLVLYAFQFGRARHAEYVLVVSGRTDVPLESIKELLGTHAAITELRSYDSKQDGWELVFELRLLREQSGDEPSMIDTLRNLAGVDEVSLLAPQLALPL